MNAEEDTNCHPASTKRKKTFVNVLPDMTENLPPQLEENFHIFTPEEQNAATLLVELSQRHIFAKWPSPGIDDELKKALLQQAFRLNRQYPGGLRVYRARSIDLLAASEANSNTYDGWVPRVPTGERLEFDTWQFRELEDIGLEQLGYSGFAIGAGGLGERLGYPDIKPAIPCEITTGISFLELYIQFILHFQARARVAQNRPDLLLPLGLMISGDTDVRTIEFMKSNNNFGMVEEQVVYLHQHKVACFEDKTGKFAMNGSYEIVTKPHGHGDIHQVLYSTGTAQKWLERGLRWWVFFQDTNGVAFRSLVSAMGVSCERNFAMNSITVPRRPGQEVGAIAMLTNDEKKDSLTINIEYNQLGSLLESTNGEGDVADETGNSPYPGNTNTLIFRLDEYVRVLTSSNGIIPEFIDPKYCDETRSSFSSPTRLECMVQEYPKLYKAMTTTSSSDEIQHAIGITQLPRWLALEPVKNNIKAAKAKFDLTGFADSGSSGEASIYFCNRQYLRAAGVDVVEDALREYAGIPVKYGARIVLHPSFGATLNEIDKRLRGSIKISSKSTLILEGDIVIKNLTLDGALSIRARPGSRVFIDSLHVENDGWQFETIDTDNSTIEPVYQLRGYKIVKKDIREIEIVEGIVSM